MLWWRTKKTATTDAERIKDLEAEALHYRRAYEREREKLCACRSDAELMRNLRAIVVNQRVELYRLGKLRASESGWASRAVTAEHKLKTIREWYDRDGSVGGLAAIMEER
jgi:hypothetical protein